jgi:hypothetical protein
MGELPVVTEATAKAKAWVAFDRIIADAASGGKHSNPWVKTAEGTLLYEPDYATLQRLLGVPLHLKAVTQSGVPALALDVWLSYELRRAGFDEDGTWPRAVHPRILPAAIAKLLSSLPAGERAALKNRIDSTGSIKGVTSSSANILGKNYSKQVDVVMSDWSTGPELLISTKRMDSSYGKNAANRVEESYGDAKNLRLRHPLAALGFVFGLRSDILEKEPDTAEWLFDLLTKLGREDDAYHATCLILLEYGDAVAVPDSGEEPPNPAVVDPGPESEDAISPVLDPQTDRDIEKLPPVRILLDKTPADLQPSRFLAEMVTRVLGATPVNLHRDARNRIRSPRTP